MSSSSSSGLSHSLNHRRPERGLPRTCRCGAESVMMTADTLKNPGRLFHCCPYGSKNDNGHLFKWTDIAMVEEMEEVESVVEKIQLGLGSLEKDFNDVEAEMETLAMETRTCEVVVNNYRKDIEAIKAVAQGCEKEILKLKDMIVCCEKEIHSLRCFKNVIVCVVVMFFVYAFM